jgi:hypothetical protein
MSPSTLASRLDLLMAFQAKAACAHTQRQADSFWRQLKPLLSTAEALALGTAWDHWSTGEGRKELDDVCAEIRREWYAASLRQTVAARGATSPAAGFDSPGRDRTHRGCRAEEDVDPHGRRGVHKPTRTDCPE